MPVEWHAYDGFDWSGARQAPMTDAQRDAVAELAADVLGLSPTDRAGVWGHASPPGRCAATVIRATPGVAHSYKDKTAGAGIGAVAVKVFKTTADARREAQKVVPFHRTQLHRLPGLPNERVQRSLDAGVRRDRAGEDRAFVVLEWVDGESLEDLIRRRWRAEPIDGALARSLLEQLLGGIVIPLWAEGTVWWDVRDANYCYAPESDRLTLIDVDSLAAYADEILETPQAWMRRDKGRETALARLRQMCARISLAQKPRSKKAVETNLARAWETVMEPALSVLGRNTDQTAAAVAALAAFVRRLEESECLRLSETS